MKSRRFQFSLCISLSLNLLFMNGVFTTFACAKESPKNSAGAVSKFGLGQPQDAQFDSAKQPYKLSAEQALNLDIINPQSDWNKVYSIGRAAYMDGDFRRAFNAFKLALIKVKAQGITDGRLKQTEDAFKSVQFRASSLDARLGFKLGANKSQKIEKVFPGSLAWLAGIKADDRILSMKEKGDVTALSVVRNGKVFSATITDKNKLVAANFINLTPLTDQSSTPLLETAIAKQITDIGLLKKCEGILTNHDLILIIDKSGSMNASFGDSGLSQWDWCREQSKDFSSVAGCFPRGITIVPFDSRYEVFHNQSASDIPAIFQKYRPSGGTDLAHPFWEQLSSYFERHTRKPTIIAVISDFCTAGEQVREGVFEASRRVSSPDDLIICLLEVGRGGRRLVAALDNDMTSVGAPYDIVDATTSEDLLQIGLKNALVAALLKRSKTGTGSQEKMKSYGFKY